MNGAKVELPSAGDVIPVTKLVGGSAGNGSGKVTLTFATADNDRISLEMPDVEVRTIAVAFRDIMLRLQQSPANGSFIHPVLAGVGHSDNLRGHTLFIFDEHLVTQAIYAVPDVDAFKLAEHIIERVKVRNPDAARPKLIMAKG